MTRDPFPVLDVPSCADCRRIRYPVSAMLVEMEAAIGEETTRAFLHRWGGCRYSVPSNARGRGVAAEWLRREVGHGTIIIPKGPLSYRARLAWSTARRLREGQSLRDIARDLNCHTRTVSYRKKKLEMLGVFPPACDPNRKDPPR